MTQRISSLAAVALLVAALPANPHPGGLDAEGCHWNRRSGDRHCHRSADPSASRPPAADRAARGASTGYVARVTDGDTLVLATGERVRLIGVDTPETVHPTKRVERFGYEAKTFTRGLVLGKRVRLEYDPGNAHLAHKDKYRRTLAYVFLPDGTLLNAEIIRRGYGFAYTRFPFERSEEFRGYEREAWRERRGLWGDVRESPVRDR